MSRHRFRIACGLLALLGPTADALAQAQAPAEAEAQSRSPAEAQAEAQAADVHPDKFCKSFRLEVGERSSGDKYIASKTVVVNGYHDGDLAIIGESASIQGEVTGDVFFFGDTLDITGHVHDTVRGMANKLSILGTVDGDLVVFGNQMAVQPGGRVNGDVLGFCARMMLEGDVQRDVRLTGGEIQLGGTIGGNARLKADTIVFGDRGRVGGDFSYQANQKLDPSIENRVGGAVEFRERVEEPEAPSHQALTFSDVMWWLVWWGMWTVGATLAGLSLIGLARPAVDRAGASISSDPLMSALIGFGAFLVIPAASFIMTFLAPPFGLSGWLVFFLFLLLAKIPVGVWIGTRLLRLVMHGTPTPVAGLLVGLPLLYLAAELPYFVGLAIWGLATWLGLGATLLGHFSRRDRTTEAEATPI